MFYKTDNMICNKNTKITRAGALEDKSTPQIPNQRTLLLTSHLPFSVAQKRRRSFTITEESPLHELATTTQLVLWLVRMCPYHMTVHMTTAYTY
jgi:hypothetical protein